MPSKINKICVNPNCKKEFTVLYKKRNKKYCCQNCYFEHSRLEKINGKEKDESYYETRKCLNCGVEFEERKKKKRNLCSDECRKEWNTKNKDKRVEKSKEAILDKYGVEYSFQLQETQEKAKDSIKKKYGVNHVMDVPEIKNKQKQKLRDRHINELKPRLDQHSLRLVDDYESNKNGNTSIHYRFRCDKCDSVFTSTLLGCGKIPICRTCHPINTNSNLQLEIENFLKANGVDYIKNDRDTISPMELDIYVPKHKLAIEVNGNYWHCELYKSSYYHLNKTKECHSRGIKLIHVFEDEIYYKKDICFSRLKNQLGLNNRTIYGRNCSVKELTNKEKNEFLEENHIQGKSIDKVRVGLYHGTELVSVMTFSKKRKVMGNTHSDSEWELIRFCNKTNTTIVGSFNKLLKYFVRFYRPTKIITYSDIRWNGISETDSIYFKSGFDHKTRTRPNYWYIKKHDWFNRQHRFNFRKDLLVEEGFDPNKTEHQIMNEKGYYKIWDCGNLKFEMTNFEDI